MKILAKAKPNEAYEYIQSIGDMILEARLIENQIRYYETHTRKPNWIVCVSEDTIKALFPDSISIASRPFLEAENKDFYAVLHRNQIAFKEKFEILKNKAHEHSIHRKTKDLPQNNNEIRKTHGVHRKR